MRRSALGQLATAARAPKTTSGRRCCTGSAAQRQRGTAASSTSLALLHSQPVWPVASKRVFSHQATMCEDKTSSATARRADADADAGDAAAQPTFSSAVAEPELELAREKLSQLLAPLGKWSLSAHCRGIERTFQFKTFKRTWEFMDAVAAECRREKHHPEWANVYNRTHVRWTTHRPEGLSMKDLRMAEVCDAKAKEYEEQAQPSSNKTEPERGGSAVHELADHIGRDACEVCAR